MGKCIGNLLLNKETIMSGMDSSARKVIALAYFHRYGWIALMMGCIYIWPRHMMYILGTGSILFSIWSLVGYICEWKHIYCSYQNAYRQSMTPHSIRWGNIKKSDAYGIPFFFLFMGVAVLVVAILHG